ncbi:MAG: hypothetical protein Tp1102MES256162_34 [Prokaryotic dsDNA virus sp.]|jgi:hypothetical protein|nr:MAG: hypothetical protein Tp1102MES256162_34 [Prokaryotic dsDNA virus sp.]|tara:strand:+ start:10738 stop:10923 length:186 start_codon:yes stop_codon:yes gene_type:complete
MIKYINKLVKLYGDVNNSGNYILSYKIHSIIIDMIEDDQISVNESTEIIKELGEARNIKTT